MQSNLDPEPESRKPKMPETNIVLRLDNNAGDDQVDEEVDFDRGDEDLIEFIGKDSHISRIEQVDSNEESKDNDRTQNDLNKLIREIGVQKHNSEDLKRKAGRE